MVYSLTDYKANKHGVKTDAYEFRCTDCGCKLRHHLKFGGRLDAVSVGPCYFSDPADKTNYAHPCRGYTGEGSTIFPTRALDMGELVIAAYDRMHRKTWRDLLPSMAQDAEEERMPEPLRGSIIRLLPKRVGASTKTDIETVMAAYGWRISMLEQQEAAQNTRIAAFETALGTEELPL